MDRQLTPHQAKEAWIADRRDGYWATGTPWDDAVRLAVTDWYTMYPEEEKHD